MTASRIQEPARNVPVAFDVDLVCGGGMITHVTPWFIAVAKAVRPAPGQRRGRRGFP